MIERILINVFFVILPLVLLPIFCSNSNKYQDIKNNYAFLTSLISTLCCMSFPIEIGTYDPFDFHYIPQLFASLFLGPIVSIFFLIITFSFQMLIDANGITLVGILSIAFVILSILYSNKVNNFSSQHRIINFSATLSTIGVFILFYQYIVNGTDHSILLSLSLLSFGIAAFLTVFLHEYIQTNIILHNTLISIEKKDVVSHLAASISHEVRNPLTTVRGFLQLLSKMDRCEKSKEYIQISIEELDRAEGIISGYLGFARPSVNKIIPLDVTSEILKLIEIVKPLANQNNVQMKLDIQQDVFIFGEKQVFQQCFINIMKNSIEAMSNGGTLFVQTVIKNNRVMIKISDNGVGMTKQQLARLGEPYFSTKGSKGTGLGMMVVFKIVESMDGTININSEIGRGTETSIVFPLADKKEVGTYQEK